MPILAKIKDLFNPMPSRIKYPKDKYPVWEFVEQANGTILARVYTNPLQEETFESQKLAAKWVHSTMRAVKELA